MSSTSPFLADSTCSVIKTLIRRRKQTTYTNHWKTYEVRTYQISVTSTYLVSTKELINKTQEKKLLAVITKKTRRHLDLESNPLPVAVQSAIKETTLDSDSNPHTIARHPFLHNIIS